MELLMMIVVLGLAVACLMMRNRLKRLESRIMQNEIDVDKYRRHLAAGVRQNGVSIGVVKGFVRELAAQQEALVTGAVAAASAQTLTIEVGNAECDHLLESRTLTVEIDDSERQ